jgi:hypothetical protein
MLKRPIRRGPCQMLPLPVATRRTCPVKGCTRAANQGHHVLYECHKDGPVVYYICEEHHSWITRAQSHAARKQHRELNEKQRWFFWYQLKNGEMKRPRKTRLDREWAGEDLEW